MTKNGMGGHAKEAYDPATGKFIEDGKVNVRHPNPVEAQKIAGGVSPQKIQKESASTMSAPTSNLGKYAEPQKTATERNEAMNLFGIEPKSSEPKRQITDKFGQEFDFDKVEFFAHDDGSVTIQDGTYVLNKYEDVNDFFDDFKFTEDQKRRFLKGEEFSGSDLKDNEISFLKYKNQ